MDSACGCAAGIDVALAAQADSTAADEGPSLVSFDWGAADTLEAWGSSRISSACRISRAGLYGAPAGRASRRGRTQVAGPRCHRALSPGLILITGRQSAVQEDLQAVAETRDVTLAEGDYLEALSDKVKGLAALYGAEVQAEERLEALHADIESARESLADAVDAVVVTHNDGHYSLRQEPVVSELLQIDQPEVPESVEPVSHGSRTFYPVTPDVLAEMSPDVVFVVDRSAAIGETPLEASTLQKAWPVPAPKPPASKCCPRDSGISPVMVCRACGPRWTRLPSTDALTREPRDQPTPEPSCRLGSAR